MWWHSPFLGIVGNQHAPLCGRFHSNSSAVARYGAFIQAKSPAKWGVHIVGMIFQTGSNVLSILT